MDLEKLHQEEIELYKSRVQELENQSKNSNEMNMELLQKVETLTNLTKMANVANQDLYSVYEHLREENLQIATRKDDEMIVEEKEDVFQQRYIGLVGESVSWLNNKAELQRRIKTLEREVERHEVDNNHLKKQNFHLLKTLEEERGMIIKSAREAERGLTSAADVIDSRLVTYESIAELQQNNQKLLALVKELTKREEEQEIQLESEELVKLNDQIKALKSEISNIRDEREQIQASLNTILKERDLFKILLSKTRKVEHMTPEIFQKMVSIACASKPSISSSDDLYEKDAHITDLKNALSRVERNLSDLRDNYDRTITKHNQELKLKDELLEKAHLKVLSECQRADVLSDRNAVLEENMSALSAEFEEARTKAQRLTFELEEKEKALDFFNSLNQALDREKEKRKDETLSVLSQALDSRLVTFESIAELQQNNQKLLELVQELTKRKEEQEILLESEELGKLNDKIEGLRSIIQNVQDEREQISRQAEIATSELQRLRNIEREARLKIERDFFKLASRTSKLVARISKLAARKSKPPTQRSKLVPRRSDLKIVEPKPVILELEPSSLEPEIDVLQPESEVMQVEPDAMQAEVEVLQPKPVVMQPESEIIHPESEIIHPEPEVIQPESEVIQPESELIQPESELIQPESELIQSESEVIQPESELIQTESEVMLAEPEVLQSVVEVLQPEPETSDPGPTKIVIKRRKF